MTIIRADCVARDARDVLASRRALFSLPKDVIYLDGNSLGVLPRNGAKRSSNPGMSTAGFIYHKK